MSTAPKLIDAHGRPCPLDRELGSGGEGTVFALANAPSLAAKVYHPKARQADRIEKLKVLIARGNPSLLKVAAWPTGLLFDAQSKQPVGFSMPRLDGFKEIWCLYLPVERLNFFPQAGWQFQVRAARNLAAAFEEVHKTGCVVGDVQLRNAFVSNQTDVRLVDCDSFQVTDGGKQYLCPVGLPHYIPPELQGKSLSGIVRTVNHDRFGLAVLIYQLLFVSRHPFAGVYSGAGDPSFEELIREFRFAQGPMARSWGMDPPPFTPTFADIPPEVGTLFRRAFERGSDKGTRPRPDEWIESLEGLEKATVACAADTGHQYWRGSKRCVWCQIANAGGPEYYFGVASGTSAFAVDDAKLQEVLKHLNACRVVDFEYNRDRYAPTEKPVGAPLPEGLDDHGSSATILAVATAVCVLLMPLGLVRGFICAIFFLAALTFGGWLFLLYRLSPWHHEKQRRVRHLRRARDDLRVIEEKWELTVRRYHRDHDEKSGSVRELVSACRKLEAEYHAELRRLAANAEAVARLRHMRFHLLADADIEKIGAGRKQSLAAHNIVTAADVDEGTIRSIKGFGAALTANLMAWKADVLRAFRFDPTTAVSTGEQRGLTMQYRARQQRALVELDQRLVNLRSLAAQCQVALQKLIPELRELVAVWEQADADLRVLQRKR